MLRSADNYLDEVEMSVTRKKMDSITFNPKTCEVQEKKLLCDVETEKETVLFVESDGKVPTQGIITIQDNKIHEVKNMKFENLYVSIDPSGNKIVSDPILITSLEVSYSNCLVDTDYGEFAKALTDVCIPVLKIEPENATNKKLEFTLDEYFYSCGAKYLFDGKILLNSSTGQLTRIQHWGKEYQTTTYITIKTTDGSNISKKIEILGYTSYILCPDHF